jgi:hypothetical protein
MGIQRCKYAGINDVTTKLEVYRSSCFRTAASCIAAMNCAIPIQTDAALGTVFVDWI